jgi:hypothetical protein
VLEGMLLIFVGDTDGMADAPILDNLSAPSTAPTLPPVHKYRTKRVPGFGCIS